MSYVYLEIKPGIDIERTPVLNMGGYSTSSGVRFFQGLLQKRGGFEELTAQPCVGIVRGMTSWADNSGNPYIAYGSDQRLQIYSVGTVYDITPIRQTDSGTPNFSTVATSNLVTVVDASGGAQIGDWVNLIYPVSVGGIVLLGYYRLQSIPAINQYVIQAAAAATGTVNNGGALPEFSTTLGQSTVVVTLDNHGYVATNLFMVQTPVTVGGITIPIGNFTVIAPITTNTFTINPGLGNATSTATAFENGGNETFEYLLSSGPSSSGGSLNFGYGVGIYGDGIYGASGTVSVPLRQWFLDHFGAFMIGNYTGSPIYVWEPPPAIGNVAIPVDTTNFPGALQPPTEVNVSFMSAPQQMLIALGCDTPGTGAFDPLLVRWCDAGDFTDWQALSTNQAGSYAIPSGSRLVGGISAANFVVIWTDVDMWLMSYLGGTGAAQFVWGFNRITGGRGLLSARSCAIMNSTVYFASYNGFFAFNGAQVVQIPCPVWDVFWQNLDIAQVDKVNAQANSQFLEVSWCFPSATGNGECDTVVTLNTADGTWTYDTNTIWARTAWIDQNVYGAPVGTDLNMLLEQAETGNDANGVAISCSAQTGWFSVSEGTYLVMMERLAADLKVTGATPEVFVTVYAQDDPNDAPTTYGPYPWTLTSPPPAWPWNIVRARGRFMSIQISSNALGVFWRVGRMRYYSQRAGRR